MKFSTKTIHIGNEPNYENSGDVVMPLHLSTTFARKKVYEPTHGYEYARTGNPTRNALEKNLAALENGTYGFAYASGLAAETNVMLMLKSGDHVIVSDDVYGGTRRLFEQVFANIGLSYSFIDLNNIELLRKTVGKRTKLLWIESPTNPLMKVSDIQQLSTWAHTNKILVVVDNTFATPYFQQPLKLDADVVLHSTTKYLGGHSDTIGGALVTSKKAIAEKLRFLQNAVGAIMSSFDSWLLLRGIKTLSVRMEQHQKNAKAVVEFLQNHKRVKKVYYPGFSGVISFELYGSLKTTVKFLESLKLIPIAESLGAIESLIEHPASMTHASIPAHERRKIGLSDTLIRLSVGLEDIADLIYDIERALIL